MGNKYLIKVSSQLEKIALNIFKKQVIAKATGLIHDPESAFNYGVRHLRDGKGQPLAGKALEDARVGMGGMRGESFQRLKNVHAQNPDHEHAFNVVNGNIEGGIHVGNIGSVDQVTARKAGVADKTTKNQSFGHSHPPSSEEHLDEFRQDIHNLKSTDHPAGKILSKIQEKDLTDLTHPTFPHRVTRPSGRAGVVPFGDKNKALQGLDEGEHAKDTLASLDNRMGNHIRRLISKKNAKIPNSASPMEIATKFQRRAFAIPNIKSKVESAVQAQHNIMLKGDLSAAITERNGRRFTIASPSTDVEAIHRVVGVSKPTTGPTNFASKLLSLLQPKIALQKHRNIYLSHAPLPANPSQFKPAGTPGSFNQFSQKQSK